MKTVSLKRSPAEAKKESVVEYKPPAYGYGTCLNLDGETMKKLGLDAKIDPGTKVNIVGSAEVVGVSMRKTAGGEDYQSLDLQITDLGVSPQQSTKKLASTLYPDMKDED